jgi:hypothetical protein
MNKKNCGNMRIEIATLRSHEGALVMTHRRSGDG